jgi:hypothetical protein
VILASWNGLGIISFHSALWNVLGNICISSF